jgi:antitoxin component YwqK of YwqJK toxin-antitoxin module
MPCAHATQQSLFRTPSIQKKVASGDVPGTNADQLMRTISHRFADLEVKQDPETDSIQAWLTQEEDLPKARGTVTDLLQDAEEIIPELGDSISRGPSDRERIIQRYPDGKPQIEREVMQDENGNFVNDGVWRVYSQQGERNIIAQGQYHRGKMEGIWMRKHAKDSSGLFRTRPFTMFEGPFTSIATFKDNKLDGLWTLQDNSDQKMFEVPYRNGQRHGTASWWYPSQVKMREVTFVNGLIHGRLREWDEQRKLIRDEEYIDGQRVIRNVTYYRPQQMETENYFLDGKLEVDGEDDWWRAEPARLVSTGTRVQHGPVNFWYDNGLPKMKGSYSQGQRDGRFTWWHANGNKQLDGTFREGQKTGRWIWWHGNGMKASEGTYEEDLPVGVWNWWNEQGQLEDRKVFGEPTNSAEQPAERSIFQRGGEENPEEMPDGLSTPPVEKAQDTPKPAASDSRDIMMLELDGLDGIRPEPSKEPASPSSSDSLNEVERGNETGRINSFVNDSELADRPEREESLLELFGIDD